MTRPTHEARPSHVGLSVLPVALVAVTVVAVQLGVEFGLPAGGPARQAALESGSAWPIRLVGAAVLSLSTGFLACGLYLDRALLRADCERVAGTYLAGGMLAVLFCLFCGAVPGFVVSWAVVAVIVVAWGRTASASSPGARDARYVTLLAVTGYLLHLGVRESFGTYLYWSRGYGAGQDQLSSYIDEHGGQVIDHVSLGIAVVGALALPVLLWRHRRRVRASLWPWLGACVVVAGASLPLGATWIGLIIGALCVLLALALAWLKPESRRESGTI